MHHHFQDKALRLQSAHMTRGWKLGGEPSRRICCEGMTECRIKSTGCRIDCSARMQGVQKLMRKVRE